MIPLCVPAVGPDEERALAEVLASGWLTEGPKNQEFEQIFAKTVGVEHAVSLNSCTSALFLALKAHDIRGEVIIPSFTFVATANAVVTAGATPVFADIEPESCNLAVADIARRITPRTEAILPIHFGGQCCDMAGILELARRHHLVVIEDSAETLGGTFNDVHAGAFGTGCFSFFPTKNITTGEGGMLTTNDAGIAHTVRTLAAHGISRSTAERERQRRPWVRSAQFAGYNFRLSSLLAALGVVQMQKLASLNEARRRNADALSAQLQGIEGITLPKELPLRRHVYQMYTIQLADLPRDTFVERLRDRGVGASVHFTPPVHLQDFYRDPCGSEHLELPQTEAVAARIVTLPMYPQLTSAQIATIAETVATCAAELRADPVETRCEEVLT
ncbi:MAG: DegT/DnrJ/EryC1/StrS family aminotransferase [Planctomycetota bacterium]